MTSRAMAAPSETTPAEGHTLPLGPSPALLALRGRLSEIEAATYAEGIDPNGPLGVWCRVQRDIIIALAAVAEEQGLGVVKHLASFQHAMRAATDRVEAEVGLLRAGTEAARQVVLSVKAETANSKEERVKSGDDLAIRLSDKIQQCLETTLLVREKRWNLRQNVSLLSLGVGVLFGAFMCGELVQVRSMGQAIIDRCRAHLAVDPATKVAYCAMNAVEGRLETVPTNR